MRTAVTRVNRASEKNKNTMQKTERDNTQIHRRNTQNTMVTVYLQQKQKMEFIGYMLWNYYL